MDMRLLAHQLGWALGGAAGGGAAGLPHQNRGARSGRSGADRLAPELRAAIRASNAHDVELYAAALKIFDARLRRLDIDALEAADAGAKS